MDTTPDSKEVCLLACTSAGRYDLLDKALSFFQMYQHRSFGVNYLTIELLIEKSQYDQALRMLNEILFNGGSEEFHHLFFCGSSLKSAEKSETQALLWRDCKRG